MKTLEGNLHQSTIGSEATTIIDSSISKNSPPHSIMAPDGHSSLPHLHNLHQPQCRPLSNMPSSIDIPFDIPITPPIPSQDQIDAITEKILRMNVKDIETASSRNVIQSSHSTITNALSRPLHNEDEMIDYSAAQALISQGWSAMIGKFIPLHLPPPNHSQIDYPSVPITSEPWHADQLESLNQYLSNTIADDSSNSVASLPNDSNHYAWLNVPTKSSTRHILPLPVPKWRKKGFKSDMKSEMPITGSRAAKNCIASPERAARIVLASMKGQGKSDEPVIPEMETTSVSVHDLAPHRDKIKKMKRTIGSDEIKSDVEERRSHYVSIGHRRRLRHQQRFIRRATMEQQQKLKEVRLPESAFDFACPFQPRHKFHPLPTRALDPAAPKSSIGLTKCLEQIPIPYHSMRFNINVRSPAIPSDKQAISTTTIASARPPQSPQPSLHRQKGPSRKGGQPIATPISADPSSVPPLNSAGPRPRRNKKSTHTARPSNPRRLADSSSRSVKGTDVLPATSLLFDHGTSEDWMCWFCEFEVFLRGFVAARRKTGWYKRQRERNRRLREIEARQNNEVLSSSGSDLDEIDPV